MGRAVTARVVPLKPGPIGPIGPIGSSSRFADVDGADRCAQKVPARNVAINVGRVEESVLHAVLGTHRHLLV